MINNKLDSLFQSWKAEMSSHLGFLYEKRSYKNRKEDKLWKISTRKIRFLLKEQINNDVKDVRDWSGSINEPSSFRNFFGRLSAWLFELIHPTFVFSNDLPTQSVNSRVRYTKMLSSIR